MYIFIEIGNENLMDIFHVNVISILNVSYSILRYIGGSKGGLRGLHPPFQISKIKRVIKENKKKKKILLKRKKRERVPWLSSFYVYTR